MRRCISEHHARIAAVIMECFHGRAAAMAEEAAYARAVYDLCRAHNILFIADEVRQGAGKTGRFLSYEHLGADVRPDLVTMGKSITGGFYPASFVLGTAEVMDLVGTGESASTFAANPLAVAAAQAAIAVIDDEGLVERATAIGKRWVEAVESWKHPLVRYVTNRGADSMVVLQGVRSQRVAALALLKGLLVFPRDDYLRISPAMVISDEEIDRAAQIMKETLDEVNEYDEIPGEFWDVTTKTSQV
ncbi:hypothetical protein M8818_007160 [Zalaria obscura]|uniref:Uncharacterized protein n=1 Tax=Zalaria obscura TaxID=2024903 RepID=A0ACC3S761_9PEZI